MEASNSEKGKPTWDAPSDGLPSYLKERREKEEAEKKARAAMEMEEARESGLIPDGRYGDNELGEIDDPVVRAKQTSLRETIVEYTMGGIDVRHRVLQDSLALERGSTRAALQRLQTPICHGDHRTSVHARVMALPHPFLRASALRVTSSLSTQHFSSRRCLKPVGCARAVL